MSSERVLKGHDLFRSLSVEEAARLSDFSAAKVFEAGESVFQFGKPATHLYMLMSGKVHLRLPAKQTDFGIVVSTVERGELFGLSPLLDSGRYTTTALCTEDTEVLSIEAKPFRDLLHGNCPVALGVYNRVAQIYFMRYLEVLDSLQDVVNHIPLSR